MICRFANVKPSIKNGNIINIKENNIDNVIPHIMTIKGNNYLFFNDSDIIFINDYSRSIKLKELKKFVVRKY